MVAIVRLGYLSPPIYRVYTSPEGKLLTELAEPIVLSSQDVIILSYGFLGDEKQEGVRFFEQSAIITSVEKVKGAKVAQQEGLPTA